MVTLTTQVGVPTVFAGALLYFVLTRVGTAMDRIEENEKIRTQMLAGIQQGFAQAIDRQTVAFEQALARQTQEFTRAITENTEVTRRLLEERRRAAP